MEGLSAREVLGLPIDAGEDAVRERYLYLARVLHPDKSGSTALFQLVARAYAMLTQPEPKPEPEPAAPPRRRPPRPPPPSFVRRVVRASEPAAPPREFIPVPMTTAARPPIDHSWPQIFPQILEEPDKTKDEPSAKLTGEPVLRSTNLPEAPIVFF